MFQSIKNIVFDLGGVIINLDFAKTYQKLAQLGNCTVEDTIQWVERTQLFKKYETGVLQEDTFFTFIKEAFAPTASFTQVEEAWNALLLDIPKERIQRIQGLRKKYALFLLSNTNYTHIKEVNRKLHQSAGVPDLSDLFDGLYYSYEMGLAKPHHTIYEHLLTDAKLNASETVFLDDTEVNLLAPKAAGWKTLHVKEPLTFIELLKNA